MKKSPHSSQTAKHTSKTNDVVDTSVETVAGQLQRIEEQLHNATTPVRERVLRRFPVVFVLLTAFGVAAVFYGFERIIAEIGFLNDRPWLILSVGVVILLTTGTLYKVLDRPQ